MIHESDARAVLATTAPKSKAGIHACRGYTCCRHNIVMTVAIFMVYIAVNIIVIQSLTFWGWYPMRTWHAPHVCPWNASDTFAVRFGALPTSGMM